MKARSKVARARAPKESPPERAPKLVYTQAPILLGRLITKEEGGFRVALGSVERVLAIDPAVDPALLDDAISSGARVIVDSETTSIVGVVTTRRGVEIDRDDRVKARVRSFEIDAKEEVLLKVPGAFVRALGHEVEIYGDRVLTRARNMAKILAAMIKLN